MALIKCPECSKEISDMSDKCIHCGFPLDEYIHDKDMSVTSEKSATIVMGEMGKSTMETQKISVKKIVIGIIVCIAFALILMLMNNYNMEEQQKEYANRAIELYLEGNYKSALNMYDKIDNKNILGDYAEKIIFMNNIGEYIYEVEINTPADGDYVNMYIGDKVKQELAISDLLCYLIGQYANAEKIGCDKVLWNIMKEYAQLYVNYENISIKQLLNNCRSDTNDNKELFFPLAQEDASRIDELIEQLNDELDYNYADNNFDNYISQREEHQKSEYDASHPIQVTNDDCKITHSRGYYYCNGTVHNVSGSTHYYVKVKVTYYDKNDEVLTTDWTYAVSSEGIKGGENQQFQIMTKVDGDVEKFKVEILEYK